MPALNTILNKLYTSRCLRHRLHHVRLRPQFSDLVYIEIYRRPRSRPVSICTLQFYNPEVFTKPYSYAATRGLFYSHMGWIFFKPQYERISLIERDDLENDPGIFFWTYFKNCQFSMIYLVVRFQHKYYGQAILILHKPISISQNFNSSFGVDFWTHPTNISWVLMEWCLRRVCLGWSCFTNSEYDASVSFF